MKRKLILLVLGAVLAFSAFAFTACGGGDGTHGGDGSYGNNLPLPNVPDTPDDKDSWLYKTDDFTINWFVDYSWFSYPEAQTTADEISKKIKALTGATVKFNSPVDDSGQMIGTMIAGDTLPDVVSVKAYTPIHSKLAYEGYAYPIDVLAEKWAPTLLDRIETDIFNYYKMGDGHIYGLPSCAYSSKYVGDGDRWAPNGAMLVRKDWYDWYNSQPGHLDITTPTGMLDAMGKVKAQFEGSGSGSGKVANLSALLLDQFNSEGNNSVSWLSQYFAAPFEDAQGNFIDQRTTSQFKEALAFLNTCYTNGYIRKTNLSATSDSIAGVISRGEAFVSLVTPQNYPGSFINAKSNNVEYIPLILRNEAGEDPVLQDLTGTGFTFNMITKTAKDKVDKIIKLFDFLYSEEGQRLVQFGIIDDTYTWAGEGSRASWTQKYLDLKAQGKLNDWGFGKFNVMYNHAYVEPISPLEGKTAGEAYFDNLKRPLTPFSYRYNAAWPNLDPNDKNFNTILTKQANITMFWAEKLPLIISANNASASVNEYNGMISFMNNLGRQDVINYYAAAYPGNKTALGVTWGWPTNDPSYAPPKMRNPNGTFSNDPVGPNGDPYYKLNYTIFMG